MVLAPWLASSLAGCVLYAVWAVCQALAVGPTGQLTPFEARTIITLVPFLVSIATLVASPVNVFRTDTLPLSGLFFALCAGLTTFVAGKYYSAALAPPQNGSANAVTAIVGAYPALAFVFFAALGLEKV